MSIDNWVGSNNRWLTQSLFWEWCSSEDKTGAIYTLRDEDRTEGGVTYKSLYKLYMSTNDPTEYTFALEYLGGWEHWQLLSEIVWMKEHVKRWRWEMELKFKSQAIAKILAESQMDGKNAYNANRFLAEGGWMDKDQKKVPVGRPSRERIKKEAEILNQKEKDILLDYERLN